MITAWQSTESTAWLDQIFEEFHREPRCEVLRREKETFDQLAAPLHDSIVLFGAGPLGRYTALGLRGTGARTVAPKISPDLPNRKIECRWMDDLLGGGYDLFIKRYAEEYWGLVCYAVPANRRPRR